MLDFRKSRKKQYQMVNYSERVNIGFNKVLQVAVMTLYNNSNNNNNNNNNSSSSNILGLLCTFIIIILDGNILQ
jgi:hypothetical protein